MSSLMQFNGQYKKGKVGLECYLVKKIPVPELNLPGFLKTVDAEPKVACSLCPHKHLQLYRFWRKPAGMFGCWVVFRWNGEEHVPDLSCPLSLESLPRDAKKLSIEENSIAWHKTL